MSRSNSRTNQQPLDMQWIERIFMRLHGRFGNTFLDKFRIGQLNPAGFDIGIENAKQVWAEELAGMSAERITAALQTRYEYPPSCDDFKANCKLAVVIPDYKALPYKADPAVNAAHAAEVMEFVAMNIKPVRDKKDWAREILQADKATDLQIRSAKEALAVRE